MDVWVRERNCRVTVIPSNANIRLGRFLKENINKEKYSICKFMTYIQFTRQYNVLRTGNKGFLISL